jgi:hypothetical protein
LKPTQKVFFDNASKFEKFQNYLLMGIAGSGKSFTTKTVLCEILINRGRLSVAAVAWTKQAAMEIYGDTICSFFGIDSIVIEQLEIAYEPDYY